MGILSLYAVGDAVLSMVKRNVAGEMLHVSAAPTDHKGTLEPPMLFPQLQRQVGHVHFKQPFCKDREPNARNTVRLGFGRPAPVGLVSSLRKKTV